jgi:hypothetical protein
MRERGRGVVYILPRCLLITGRLRDNTRIGFGGVHEQQKILTSHVLRLPLTEVLPWSRLQSYA